jgi:glucosamine 6-phosphate synthetase-like amidotransferase/phosphosugar isomerase protein
MCGIAGYSLSASSAVERTLAAQALLAGIAERGADAVGYAHRARDGRVAIHKQRSGASKLLERVVLPAETTEALVHVRDYTKGHPRIEANNHPIRHGAVVGVHNGIIFNDDELMAQHGFERAEPQMTVDSEAIFALAESYEGAPQALEQLRGSMATAWLDERRPGTLFLARGVGRPLWLGTGRQETLFASTKAALEVAERYLGLKLRKRELREGTRVAVADGRVFEERRFDPDRNFEERTLPAVRAPHEGAFCLQRLAALATLT